MTIAASPHFQGFLGFDGDGNGDAEKVNVFILSSEIGSERVHYMLAIEQLAEAEYSGILPRIIEHGMIDSAPYYITRDRNGEFLSEFARKQTLPPRKAARMVADFIESYLQQLEKRPIEFTAESLWVEETLLGPTLGVRDVFLSHDAANTDREKARLLHGVFLDLFDGDIDDPKYIKWLKTIRQNSTSMAELGNALMEFSSTMFVESSQIVRDRVVVDDHHQIESGRGNQIDGVGNFQHSELTQGTKRAHPGLKSLLNVLRRPKPKRIFGETSYLELEEVELVAEEKGEKK